MMKVFSLDVPPERFYFTGALFTAHVYTNNVSEWWTLDKLPTMLWRSFAWPWYLPQMLIYGVEDYAVMNEI